MAHNNLASLKHARVTEPMPSAKEIAEAKAAARKKEPNLSVDWADAKAVRALVDKYVPLSRRESVTAAKVARQSVEDDGDDHYDEVERRSR